MADLHRGFDKRSGERRACLFFVARTAGRGERCTQRRAEESRQHFASRQHQKTSACSAA
jgi:hypothetical protein